jgi:phosphatidylglycerophosphate synthase
MIQCRLLCNLFDGMVAIEGGKRTKTGDIYNELPDRISDSIILIAAGYGFQSEPLLGWAGALLAMLTAYVRALGASVGGGQQFCGPMSKSHRMAVLTIASIVAALCIWFAREFSFPWLKLALAVICAGSAITVWRRVARVAKELEAK